MFDIYVLSRGKGRTLSFPFQTGKFGKRRWMMDFKQLRWYLIKTHPKKEEIARINLENQGIEVYLPKKACSHYINGRIFQKISPLFPCYLFAKFSAYKMFRKVSYTRGVSKIVCFNNMPVPLDDEEI